MEPNVLVLDYVDVAAGDETLKNTFIYPAQQFAFQKNGLDRNPWDSAVQFKDEFIKKEFPAGSGFKATYRFTIEGAVPASLFAVVERPDLYRITVNGQPLSTAEGSWWLDRSFGKLDIRPATKGGENVLELVASPFTIYHEIEAVYILGDFGVKPAEAGFAIVPDAGLGLGQWNEQIHPLYGAGVAYAESFDLPEPKGTYRVSLPSWYGSVSKVQVNGSLAGYIEVPPWELDVTRWIRPGKNTVEVVVIGTLKNTLGPHHGNPPLGTAWPASFHKAPAAGPPPGSGYHTVGYGLFEPFTLRNAVSQHNAP